MSRLDDRAADVTGDRVHHPIRIGGEGRFQHRPPVAELDGAGEAYREEEGAAARQEARALLATFGDARAALLDHLDAVGRD
ncbi:hypothetical protein [Micromonospora haikouensis]|uniref:hypothetical protein n=1 Tax=Micromonospora haikouensis TaxID=686309 RepID=UPI00379F9568